VTSRTTASFRKTFDALPEGIQDRAGEAWIWFWIGSHTDYDQLLKRR
jgi:hypothetical protein